MVDSLRKCKQLWVYYLKIWSFNKYPLFFREFDALRFHSSHSEFRSAFVDIELPNIAFVPQDIKNAPVAQCNALCIQFFSYLRWEAIIVHIFLVNPAYRFRLLFIDSY